jgi:hypothetical protein
MAAEGINLELLLGLKERLKERSSVVSELDGFLTGEANRMFREEDANRLQEMAAEIYREAAEAVSREEHARRRSAATNELGNMVIGVINELNPKIAGLSWNGEAAGKAMAARRSGRQQCFGTVVVGIGKGGVPSDVHVILISARARARNRPESEIIREFQQRGLRLFSPETFRSVTKGLVKDVLLGRFHLPIPQEQLPLGLTAPSVAIGTAHSFQWVPQYTDSRDERPGNASSTQGTF